MKEAYGFRWSKVQIDGRWHKVKVRDDEERNVMKAIVAWRSQKPPWVWDQISQHLRYHLKLKTKDGREWDVNRVRRCWKAELQLRLQEERADP